MGQLLCIAFGTSKEEWVEVTSVNQETGVVGIAGELRYTHGSEVAVEGPCTHSITVADCSFHNVGKAIETTSDGESTFLTPQFIKLTGGRVTGSRVGGVGGVGIKDAVIDGWEFQATANDPKPEEKNVITFYTDTAQVQRLTISRVRINSTGNGGIHVDGTEISITGCQMLSTDNGSINLSRGTGRDHCQQPNQLGRSRRRG